MWRSFLLATPPRPACLCDSGLYTVRALGRFLAIRAISHLHIVAVMDREGHTDHKKRSDRDVLVQVLLRR